MAIDEVEVYVTPDGLGRAAIVRRSDGFFCIYLHWKWSEATVKALNLETGGAPSSWFSWFTDDTPTSLLYDDKDPERGVYGTLDDARREMRSLRGFSDAILKSSGRAS